MMDAIEEMRACNDFRKRTGDQDKYDVAQQWADSAAYYAVIAAAEDLRAIRELLQAQIKSPSIDPNRDPCAADELRIGKRNQSAIPPEPNTNPLWTEDMIYERMGWFSREQKNDYAAGVELGKEIVRQYEAALSRLYGPHDAPPEPPQDLTYSDARDKLINYIYNHWEGPDMPAAVGHASAILHIVATHQPAPEPDPLANIFEAIRRERAYQDAKWGTVEQNPHVVHGWINIMRGELNEAFLAREQDTQAGFKNALCEILQVVAVGVACLEQWGVVERPQPNEDAAHADP